MKQLSVVVVAGLIGVAVAAGPAWACDAAGPNTHVGVVTQLDAKQHRFTIKDAQTGKPIVFVASASRMPALNIGDQVAVKYEEHDGMMTAKEIR